MIALKNPCNVMILDLGIRVTYLIRSIAMLGLVVTIMLIVETICFVLQTIFNIAKFIRNWYLRKMLVNWLLFHLAVILKEMVNGYKVGSRHWRWRSNRPSWLANDQAV
jgi:hypothetical protein